MADFNVVCASNLKEKERLLFHHFVFSEFFIICYIFIYLIINESQIGYDVDVNY